MQKKLKVGVIQARIPLSVKEGEESIRKFLTQAKNQEVNLLGLPEDCLCGLFSELNNIDPISRLSELAKEFGISLFGSNATKEGDQYFGTGFFIDSTGMVVSKIHKMLLSKPEKENGFSSGDTIQIFNTDYGKMAILVCRDAFNRYSPQWLYELKKRSVEYLLVPSMSLNFDKNSVEYWTNSMWLLGRWFDIYIFAPGTVGKNYTPYPSFGKALIVERDKGFLKIGSETEEELLVADISVRSPEKIEEDFNQKWDPTAIPELKFVEVN